MYNVKCIMYLQCGLMDGINATTNMGQLKTIQETVTGTPAATHCSHLADVKAEKNFWEHERTLTRPAAARTLMKGTLWQYFCIPLWHLPLCHDMDLHCVFFFSDPEKHPCTCYVQDSPCILFS